MLCALRGGESMKHRQPDHTLGLCLFQPSRNSCERSARCSTRQTPPLLPTASALGCSRATINRAFVDPPICLDQRSAGIDLEFPLHARFTHAFPKEILQENGIILTSIFFFQMTLAQQDQTNFEGKHANLTGPLTEIRQR